MTPKERAFIEAGNGYRQFDRMLQMINEGIRSDRFRFLSWTVSELNRLAVEQLVDRPGHYRPAGTKITDSYHEPPPAQGVHRFVDEMCEYVNDNWGQSPLHLAAYVLWRINWIHPYEDGNGRTARAASYMILCVALGYRLPGKPTIPDLIAEDPKNRRRYYKALEDADRADGAGQIDVGAMEELLEELLAKQIVGAARSSESRVDESDGGTRAEPGMEAKAAETAKDKDTSRDEPKSRRWWWIPLIVAAIITAIAVMLSTDAGQRLLGIETSPPTDAPTASAAPE